MATGFKIAEAYVEVTTKNDPKFASSVKASSASAGSAGGIAFSEEFQARTAKTKDNLAKGLTPLGNQISKTTRKAGNQAGTAFVGGVSAQTDKINSSIGSKIRNVGTKEAGSAGKKSGGLFKKAFSGPLASLAGSIGGVFAVGKAFSFVKDSISGYQDHLKVVALTASTIKTTGGAANLTTKQVSALSDALEAKTGVDGDQIQSGNNLLLTFKNLRNETGKGNDIFNQTSSIMTDMSVAMGQSTKTSAIQLGKALNDPVKGMAALSKVGVTFTDGQKKQVAAMVKAGDTLGAQKVILKELNSEFGGAAKAAETPGQKLGVIYHSLQDQIGAALLPAFNKLLAFVQNKLLPGFSALIAYLQQHWPQIMAAIHSAIDPVVSAFKSLAGFVQNNAGFFEKLGKILLKVAPYVLAIVAAIRIWIIAQAALDAVLNANPISLIIIGIAALVVGIIELVRHIGAIKGAFVAAFDAVKGAVLAVVDWIKKHWDIIKWFLGPMVVIITAIVQHWTKIKAIFSSGISGVKKTVSSGISSVVGFFKKLPGQAANALGSLGKYLAGKGKDLVTGLWNGAKSIWNSMKAWVASIPGATATSLGPLTQKLLRKGRDLLNGFLNGAKGIWTSMKTWVGNIPDATVESLGPLTQKLVNKGRDILGGMLSGAKSEWNNMKTWVGGIGGAVVKALGNVGKLLYAKGKGLMGGLKDGASAALNEVENAFISPLNWIGKKVVKPFLGTLHHYLKGIGFPDLSSGIPDPLIKIKNRFTGGPLNPGDLSWVGEKGPELVRVGKAGVHVYSNKESLQMTGGRGPVASGLPGYFLGGVIGKIKDVGDWTFDETKKGAKAGIKGARTIAGTVVGATIRTAEKAANLAIGQIPGTDTFRKFADGIMKQVADGAEDLIKGKGHKAPAGGISIPKGSSVQRWAGTVKSVLSELHQPASLASAYLNLIGFESAGNPKAVNKTDINWMRGYPSVGLAQVIRPTFQKWAGKYLNVGPKEYGVSENPHANIYSSMRYGIGDYGSILNIPGIKSVLKGGNYRPYDGGGDLPPGWTMAWNGTRKTETVRTAEQEKALHTGGTTTNNFYVTIPAKDLAEVKGITDLFNKLTQAARAGGATLARA